MLEAGEASAADGEWAPKIRAVTGHYFATACILRPKYSRIASNGVHNLNVLDVHDVNALNPVRQSGGGENNGKMSSAFIACLRLLESVKL